MTAHDQNSKKAHICVDCGMRSPTTDTNYTLISARHGWRLTPGENADGVRVMQWRCPKCWDRKRGAATTAGRKR